MNIDPFLRKQPWKFRGKGPTGRNLCFCGCGKEVGPKRSSSAGPECVKAWQHHSDLNHIKFVVGQRDKGVCAQCGSDTEKLKQEWASQLMAYEKSRCEKLMSAGRQAEHFRYLHWTSVLNLAYGDPNAPKPPSGFPKKDRKWWEADHIVPVVEGGGGCGPDGYRTLCIPCHKAETKRLRGRMSRAVLTPCCQKKPEMIKQDGDVLAVRCACGADYQYNQRQRRYLVPA